MYTLQCFPVQVSLLGISLKWNFWVSGRGLGPETRTFPGAAGAASVQTVLRVAELLLAEPSRFLPQGSFSAAVSSQPLAGKSWQAITRFDTDRKLTATWEYPPLCDPQDGPGGPWFLGLHWELHPEGAQRHQPAERQVQNTPPAPTEH